MAGSLCAIKLAGVRAAAEKKAREASLTSYPFCNKKKVRGWKRQSRKIDALINTHLNLNKLHLEKYGYDNVELWLAPWSNLTKRYPPLWLQRKYLSGIFRIYEEWDNQLKAIYDSYYLKIWLFYPRFMNTQIVAAIGDKINYYNALFSEHSEKAIPESYKIKEIEIYNWKSFVDQDVYPESEVDDKEHLAYLTKYANSVEVINEERHFIFNFGNIWVNE